MPFVTEEIPSASCRNTKARRVSVGRSFKLLKPQQIFEYGSDNIRRQERSSKLILPLIIRQRHRKRIVDFPAGMNDNDSAPA
jgi:hypothetical protein